MPVAVRSSRLAGRLRVVVGLIALTGLAACSSGARDAAMTVPVAPNQIISDTSPLKNAITVGDVTGGSETNPILASKVSNGSFKSALESSLTLSVLKGGPDAPYKLNANLVSLDQPTMGFNMTVTSVVKYTLLAKDKPAPVMEETVVTPYTANFSDAFVGVERLRLANEGSMRENIREIISRIFAASKPGGALAGTATVKTSSLQ